MPDYDPHDTSGRTVANQLAAVYRKLGVASRVELACELADHPTKTRTE